MQESTNSQSESPPSEAPGGESPTPTAAIDQIAELLAEPEAEAAGETEKPSESKEDGPPKTINEFAERHGVDVKDLYALEFNFGDGDGESRTLSEMKDIVAESNQFEVDRLTFEETKTKRETEFVRAQAELQELVGMLPKNAVTPELLQVIANKRAKVVERETGLTLTAIPDWQDSDKETADRAEMREHLSEYGFHSNYLDSVTDHKTLKYIRDNMQRQQRINRVLAQVKQVNKPGHRPSAKPTKPAATPSGNRKARTVETQVSQVAELLSKVS